MTYRIRYETSNELYLDTVTYEGESLIEIASHVRERVQSLERVLQRDVQDDLHVIPHVMTSDERGEKIDSDATTQLLFEIDRLNQDLNPEQRELLI